jgi:DnaK suppressor protein
MWPLDGPESAIKVAGTAARPSVRFRIHFGIACGTNRIKCISALGLTRGGSGIRSLTAIGNRPGPVTVLCLKREERGVAVTSRTTKAPVRGVRSTAEVGEIRQLLQGRYDELSAEHNQAAAAIDLLGREQHSGRAGDDEADSGTRASEREQALSLMHGIGERRIQVENALVRLADGQYGWCEGCGSPIAVERLAVFPWATSCVACQQQRERRAA